MKKSKLTFVILAIMILTLSFTLSGCEKKYNITFGAMENGCVVADMTSAAERTKVTLTAKPNDGYQLVEGSLMLFDWPGSVYNNTFSMENRDVVVNAKFERAYAINYMTAEHGSVSGLPKAAKGQVVQLTVTPSEGYGIVENSLKVNGEVIVDNTFTMPEHDVTITAAFDKVYEITFESMTNGLIGANKLKATVGDTIKLNIEADKGYIIDDSSLMLNGVNIGANTTFTMPNSNVKVAAAFVPYTYKRINKEGAQAVDGQYILFGEYPQTIATAQALANMSKTVDADGYYKSGNGRYAKAVALTEFGFFKFSDGQLKEEGKEYYFKVEPIKWRILKEANGNAYVLCETAIDAKNFIEKSHVTKQSEGYETTYFNNKVDKDVATIYANNWEYSDIRGWLNSQFILKAFGNTQKDLIQYTQLDNKTTARFGDTNKYAMCQRNTQDQIFLPSWQDMTNVEYGFSGDEYNLDLRRSRQPSDYANAFFTDLGQSWGSTFYTRSPTYDDSGEVYSLINKRGDFVNGYCFNPGQEDQEVPMGVVVPALTIKLG